ncbi:MAG: chromosome segregation protein SMC [Candidatus Omnitrophota bacterium]
MFLKRLELYGFKSFAEKTRLDFESGVTAIVGPNGCGKSNIVDSIKWVLGEQSVSSLRGGKMEDVIFYGADKTEPVGFAEVSLTISNAHKLLPLDYDEITITRRLFRSGESEYLINKAPVRLKDIAELIMDTGMGTRSYSLIEQGRVDQVLNAKPQERRTLLEEASGITKYKAKKEEALRKLERTQDNLLRLSDIISEVRQQIKSMERQVSKAERYKEDFDKLKALELTVSQHEYSQLKREKTQRQNEISLLEQEETALNSEAVACFSSLEKEKQALNLAGEIIARAQTENYEALTAITTADNKIAINQERIEELNKRKDELEHHNKETEEKIAVTAEQAEETQKQLAALNENRKTKTSAIIEQENAITTISEAIQAFDRHITEKKTEELEFTARQTRIKNSLAELDKELTNLNARQYRLKIEDEKTAQELTQAGEQSRLCAENILSLREQLHQLTRQSEELKSALDAKQKTKQAFSSRLEQFNQNIASLESQINFLQEITKNYEGFAEGVKVILAAIEKQNLQVEGFRGVLANMIAVMPENQLAVEMALGENSQLIVVESPENAAELIKYLKAKEEARASFICLNNIPAQQPKEIRHPLIMGKILDFVKTEAKYQGIIEYLLDGAFVVPDLNTGRKILSEVEDNIKLVTLQGEVLTRTVITGGSAPKNAETALIGRRERIAGKIALLEKIKAEKTEIEKLKASQEEEINHISEFVQEKELAANKLKLEVNSKETEQANIENHKIRLRDETLILTANLNETNEQLQTRQAEIEKLNITLEQFSGQAKAIQEEIQRQYQLIAEKNQEKQALLVETAKAQAEFSALEKTAEDIQTRLRMIREAEEEQKKAQLARKSEIADIAQKTEQIAAETERLKAENLHLSAAKVKTEEKLAAAARQRLKTIEQIQSLDNTIKQNRETLEALQKKKTAGLARLTELKYRKDLLKDKMQRSYHVDLETTAAQDNDDEIPPDTGAGSLLEGIETLKKKIEAMGPVNLVAIEENEQLQQRYNFLSAQQEDLNSAKESLNKAIVQINRTAKNMFAESLQKIQGNFKEYFRILFNGGDAQITLLDENDILESGIEITVRPPGKKTQNISLLSGGEKTLITIALLFSIFKVKPSPFCILDEIDAALDEANINRFTALLGEFLKDSQFLIITHNKRTINMANAMYGITMEKLGISRIVSVKLSEKQEKEEKKEMVSVEN